MKYLIVVPDGSGDDEIASLGARHRLKYLTYRILTSWPVEHSLGWSELFRRGFRREAMQLI